MFGKRLQRKREHFQDGLVVVGHHDGHGFQSLRCSLARNVRVLRVDAERKTIVGLAAERPLALIIEDDEAIRGVLSAALTEAGYAVRTARNGEEALAVVGELGGRGGPALILLDLEMPRLDGEGFALRYGALPGRHAPVVVISGGAEAQQVAARISALELIPKPFDVDEVVGRVERHLQRGAGRGPRAVRRAA